MTSPTNPMTTADAKAELVARAIWPLAEWGEYADAVNAARAAITALEAPHSRTEAITPEMIEAGFAKATDSNAVIDREELVAIFTAMQAARPIDQQEAMEDTEGDPTCAHCRCWKSVHEDCEDGTLRCPPHFGIFTPIAPVQDDDAEEDRTTLVEEIYDAMPTNARGESCYSLTAIRTILSVKDRVLSNRLGNQSVGGEGRG